MTTRERDPERSNMIRIGIILGTVILLGLIAFIPISHDIRIVFKDRERGHALFKNFFGPPLHPPWRGREFASNTTDPYHIGSEDVRKLSGGVYLVPSWVERQEPDGTWTPRKCTSRWRRDGFDDWCLESRQVEGEQEMRLDWDYPPTGDPTGLWIDRFFR